MQDFALAGQRSAEDDEPVIYERVHKVRVLVPAGQFPQIARPIPWATTFEANCEEHRLNLATGTRLVRDARRLLSSGAAPELGACNATRPCASGGLACGDLRDWRRSWIERPPAILLPRAGGDSHHLRRHVIPTPGAKKHDLIGQRWVREQHLWHPLTLGHAVNGARILHPAPTMSPRNGSLGVR